MRLNLKIMIVICGIFIISIPVFYWITNKIIMGTFIELETKNIKTDLKRVINALDNDIQDLEATGGDWAAWDETRDFVNNQNQAYIENNLSGDTLANLGLNYMIFFNKTGDIVYSTGVQSGDEQKEVPVSEDLLNQIPNQKTLLVHRDASDAKTGIMLLSEGIAIISVWPISNNETTGPVSGTLVMGRDFDEKHLRSLEERTQLKVEVQRMDKAPDDFNAAGSDLSKGVEIAINNDLSDVISAYGFFKDIYGNDSLILKVSAPRDIYNYGKVGTNYFRLAHMAFGLSIFVVLFFTLRSVVLNPILSLKGHVLAVGRSGDLSARLSLKNRDEIGELSREFDRMLGQLSETRDRLMEQSYYSGIGEMASGVLHNIRNILTPMVGQIDKIKERIDDAPLHNMEQAASELNAGNLDGERERSLKRYIQLACTQMGGVCADINSSITIVLEQAAHMEAVLSRQDKSGIFQKAPEPLSVNRIIGEAINIMPTKLRDAVAIEIEHGLAGLPQVYAERIVLIQVVTNLLNNASESILRKGLKKGNIWISGTCEMEGEIQKVHIIIRDNGEGIDRENLKKIFNRGYSTKTPKASGLGLHWSSNALSAINGELWVESEGAGHGSSFHIKIPAHNN